MPDPVDLESDASFANPLAPDVPPIDATSEVEPDLPVVEQSETVKEKTTEEKVAAGEMLESDVSMRDPYWERKR